MFGSYRHSFGPESVDELNANIDTTHEEFLREDDPEKKADALRIMSAYAMQFLYLVPHDKKFLFKETERVLHHSAMNISDFDPREASVAFEYLSKYSHNILDQPWRKDFHTIKLTCGFYVHNISAQLKNAHEIFVTMGYAHVDEFTLKVTPKLDEKRLKSISRDMIVASQECLILSQIWQRVADQEPDYPLTIGEVFEFRKKYLGNTDAICKTLLLDIRRRNYEAKMQYITKATTGKNFVPVDKLIDIEGMDSNSNDIDSTDGSLASSMERKPDRDPELELVEKVLKNTKIMHEREHIYDPVYSGENPNYPHYNHHQSNNSYNSYYGGGTASSAFAPALNRQPPPAAPYTALRSGRESTNSPLIPKSVLNFYTNPTPPVHQSYKTSSNPYVSSNYYAAKPNSGTNGMISSSSSTSGVGPPPPKVRHSYGGETLQNQNHPLKFSKIPPAAVDDYQIGTGRREPYNNGKTMNWSEFSSGTNVDGRRYSDRPMDIGDNIRISRKSILSSMPGPGELYPDDGYFPRVVKPTPIHTVPQSFNQNHNGRRYQHDGGGPSPRGHMEIMANGSGGNDMMHEALAYASEINQGKFRHHTQTNGDISMSTSQSTSAQIKSGWDTDTRSYSSFDNERDDGSGSGRSPGSTDGSSCWDIEGGTIQRPKQYQEREARSSSVGRSVSAHSRLNQLTANNNQSPSQSSDSSPDSVNEKKEIHQYPHRSHVIQNRGFETSRSPPAIADPTTKFLQPNSSHKAKNNTSVSSIDAQSDLQNLDEVYYQHLLKKGIKPEEELRQPSFPPEVKTLDVNQSKSAKPSPRDKQVIGVDSSKPTPTIMPWDCRHCTFRNKKSDKICEICFKSKDFFDEDEEDAIAGISMPKLYSQPADPPKKVKQESTVTPMETIPCPTCTLLNHKGRNMCEACGVRLRNMDSPKPI